MGVIMDLLAFFGYFHLFLNGKKIANRSTSVLDFNIILKVNN
jgi:hypothetical protein